MTKGIVTMLLLGTLSLGGVLLSSGASAERVGEGRVADPARELILGLAPEGALARATMRRPLGWARRPAPTRRSAAPWPSWSACRSARYG